MKKRHTRLICSLLTLVLSVGMTMTAFAASPNDNTEVITSVGCVDGGSLVLDETGGNIQTAGALPYRESFWVGDTKDSSLLTNIFYYHSGYRGPITVNVMNLDTSKYKVRIMIFGTNGLILRDDDWMPDSNLKVINATGEQAIQSVSIGIGPRPKLLFQAPWKEFEVRVNW